jgi:hypothetical protein
MIEASPAGLVGAPQSRGASPPVHFSRAAGDRAGRESIEKPAITQRERWFVCDRQVLSLCQEVAI